MSSQWRIGNEERVEDVPSSIWAHHEVPPALAQHVHQEFQGKPGLGRCQRKETMQFHAFQKSFQLSSSEWSDQLWSVQSSCDDLIWRKKSEDCKDVTKTKRLELDQLRLVFETGQIKLGKTGNAPKPYEHWRALWNFPTLDGGFAKCWKGWFCVYAYKHKYV